MDPIDREVAWMTVGEGLLDINAVQRTLHEYAQTGQVGALADFLADKNLILPHDAVVMTETAKTRADRRRQQMDAAIKEYNKLGGILDHLLPQEYPNEPAPQPEVKKAASGIRHPDDTTPKKIHAAVEPSPAEPTPKNLRRKSGKKRAKPPADSDIIIEEDVVVEKRIHDAGTLQGKSPDDTVAIMPASQIRKAMQRQPVQDRPAPPPVKLPYIVLGFATGVLLCSILFFAGSFAKRMFGSQPETAVKQK